MLFAVLDHYREALKRSVPLGFWPAARSWIERVDNWAHADDLARVYSWALAARHDRAYPDMVQWNRDERLWHRRVSIVSLVHYSGKNAVFLPPDDVFPLVEHCLADERPEIQKSIGWVLREMTAAYPDEAVRFLTEHRNGLSRVALRRATERLDPDVVARIHGASG